MVVVVAKRSQKEKESGIMTSGRRADPKKISSDTISWMRSRARFFRFTFQFESNQYHLFASARARAQVDLTTTTNTTTAKAARGQRFHFFLLFSRRAFGFKPLGLF